MFHSQEATVLRDGEKHNITAEKLVVGDVIFVKFGDRVPADIRVTEARGFKVHSLCVCSFHNLVAYNCLWKGCRKSAVHATTTKGIVGSF